MHTLPRGMPGDADRSLLHFSLLAFACEGIVADVPLSHPVTMMEMVFPDQTNHYGTLFGGHALRLMDKAAFVAASRHARSAVVTACSERVDFKIPARQGDLIELTATVIAAGRSSMTVAVDLFAEDLLTGERSLCAQGRFVLVAVDQDGKPRPVQAVSDDVRQVSQGGFDGPR